MRKYLFYIRLLLGVALLAMMLPASCTRPADDPVLKDPPVLVGSSPANGEVNVQIGLSNITLSFDQNIFCPAAGHSRITFTGSGTAAVAGVSNQLNTLTISISGLEKGHDYKLTVPKGVVTGPTKVEAAEIVINFSTIMGQQIAAQLCTPNPSSEAVKLYNYLKQQYGQNIISGTMAKVAWNIDEAEMVHSATGKYPAMTTFDYIFLYASPANWIDYSQTQVVEDWWANNGIVGACWHWNVPRYEGAGVGIVTYRPDETTFRPSNATIEGTWENTVVKADFAKIAGYLKLLRDKHIPIVWRPLHEAAGNIYEYTNGTAWFWWGRDGAAAYRSLWRYMYDYFQSQGLNNLIWVWTTQTKDSDFYPGNNYVDIIGRDIYNQTNANDNAAQFDLIAQLYTNKLVTLSECGNVAKISDQWNKVAKWSYFMPWYDNDQKTLEGHEHANTQWWIDAVSQPFVITRDEMPSLK